MSILSIFGSLAAIIAVVPVITEALKKAFKADFGAWPQIISWLVSIALCMLGYFLNLGMFEGVQWYYALAAGFGCGLASNGVFDIELVQKILEAIFKTGK
jgi:hypothetical protein